MRSYNGAVPRAELPHPSAAAMDEVILRQRSTQRTRLVCGLVFEAIFGSLLFLATFHLLVVTVYIVAFAALGICFLTARQCWSDADIEKARFNDCCGPLTVMRVLFFGRLGIMLLCVMTSVEVGVWYSRHQQEHRSDKGGVVAGMILIVLLFLTSFIQAILTYQLLQTCRVDLRINYTQRRVEDETCGEEPREKGAEGDCPLAPRPPLAVRHAEGGGESYSPFVAEERAANEQRTAHIINSTQTEVENLPGVPYGEEPSAPRSTARQPLSRVADRSTSSVSSVGASGSERNRGAVRAIALAVSPNSSFHTSSGGASPISRGRAPTVVDGVPVSREGSRFLLSPTANGYLARVVGVSQQQYQPGAAPRATGGGSLV